MIYVCDKLSNAISRFVDVVIVVEVNFFLFESADESFGISVLLRASALDNGYLNTLCLECGDISV